MNPRYNTLIISDLHLGEDLSLSATKATTRHLEVLERQLTGFLDHYASRRRDGRPWRLLINGDMVDFLSVCLLPGDHRLGASTREPTADEHTHGLRRGQVETTAKLKAVVDRHEIVFRALAAFLGAGHSVDIVCGNHDVELHWAQAQHAFRSEVARLWSAMPASARPSAKSAQEIAAAIHFHPWFFYEKGVLWAEHGHQYDECSSLDYQLEPVGPDGEQIATNVDFAGVRYVSNRIDEAEPHTIVEWSCLGYARFAWSLGLRGLWRLFLAYVAFAFTVLQVWRAHAPRSQLNRIRRQTHFERMAALARRFDIDEERLQAIDRLRQRPVVTHLRRLVSVLMIDRLAIFCASFVAVCASFVFLSPLWAVVFCAFLLFGSRFLHSMSHKARQVNPEIALASLPEQIGQHVDARFIVFGHTHEPVARQLAEGRWYFNTGTWLPTGKPGLLRSFTHIVIRHGERGPEATLCQWRDGASREFTPGWVPNRMATKEHAPAAAATAQVRAA